MFNMSELKSSSIVAGQPVSSGPASVNNPRAAAERLPSNSLPPIGIEIEDSLEQLGLDTSNLSPYQVELDQASPKPQTRNRETKDARDKRPVKLVHHANKGI